MKKKDEYLHGIVGYDSGQPPTFLVLWLISYHSPFGVVVIDSSLQRVLSSRGLKLVLLALMPE